jgi:hypothetical protein
MSVDSNRILEDLSRRQFLRPHATIGDALGTASMDLGFCAGAASEALRWLDINPLLSIGRLRRIELTQLARSIYRFWKCTSTVEAEQAAS